MCLSAHLMPLRFYTFSSAFRAHRTLVPSRMPKNNKNGKMATAKAAEDFDNMLSEFRTADLANPAASPRNFTTTSYRSSSGSIKASSVLSSSGPAIKRTISEEDIIQAVLYGDLKQLKRWAEQGVRVHTAEALCQAAASGKLEVVRYLVKEGGADVNLDDEDGYTPLYMAAQYGHTAIVRYLVNHLGADVDKASHGGMTPLVIAVLEGHLDMSRCLVKELGADVNHRTHNGNTPCHAASGKGDLRMLHCLVKELGADVNTADNYGFTPLLQAIEDGHLHVVRGLIEDLGADINEATHDGRTLLMVASHGGHAKIVHLLIKHGADSQACSPEFGTAADFSKEFGAPVELTEYLEAKMNCSNPSCSGAGIKKCTGCKQARYCEQACQLAHWPAHKAACKAHQAKAGKVK
jgi:ankyrin repeat protein